MANYRCSRNLVPARRVHIALAFGCLILLSACRERGPVPGAPGRPTQVTPSVTAQSETASTPTPHPTVTLVVATLAADPTSGAGATPVVSAWGTEHNYRLAQVVSSAMGGGGMSTIDLIGADGIPSAGTWRENFAVDEAIVGVGEDWQPDSQVILGHYHALKLPCRPQMPLYELDRSALVSTNARGRFQLALPETRDEDGYLVTGRTAGFEPGIDWLARYWRRGPQPSVGIDGTPLVPYVALDAGNSSDIAMYFSPTRDSPAGTLTSSDVVTATARSLDGTMIEVIVPGNQYPGRGWIERSAVRATPAALEPLLWPCPEAIVTLKSYQWVNVRAGPGLDHDVLSRVNFDGSTLDAVGRSEGTDWVQVVAQDYPSPSGLTLGWISAEFIDLPVPMEVLPVTWP